MRKQHDESQRNTDPWLFVKNVKRMLEFRKKYYLPQGDLMVFLTKEGDTRGHCSVAL